MIRYKIYNDIEKYEKVWIDSSNIFFSKMVEYPDKNAGDLFIMFNNGSVYKYINVKFEDYLLFRLGGNECSQGKALNKFIKNKYSFEKVTDFSTKEELLNELNEIISKEQENEEKTQENISTETSEK